MSFMGECEGLGEIYVIKRRIVFATLPIETTPEAIRNHSNDNAALCELHVD